MEDDLHITDREYTEQTVREKKTVCESLSNSQTNFWSNSLATKVVSRSTARTAKPFVYHKYFMVLQ